MCNPGYTGTHCDVDIDECALYSPCQNEATCEHLIADYQCLCTSEYGGKNCSELLIGCVTNDCVNGATCQPFYNEADDLHSYTCACPPGFRGVTCEISTTATFQETSYVTHNATAGSSELDVSLSFRTTLADGVLVYNLADEDYLLLSLQDGDTLELRYRNSFKNERLHLQTDKKV